VYGEVGAPFADWLAEQLAGLGAKPSFLDVGAELGRLVWQVAMLCPQSSLVKGTEIVRRRCLAIVLGFSRVPAHQVDGLTLKLDNGAVLVKIGNQPWIRKRLGVRQREARWHSQRCISVTLIAGAWIAVSRWLVVRLRLDFYEFIALCERYHRNLFDYLRANGKGLDTQITLTDLSSSIFNHDTEAKVAEAIFSKGIYQDVSPEWTYVARLGVMTGGHTRRHRKATHATSWQLY